MKIIGVTVGTTTPKPNFDQTNPKKGDYIKNKPDFDGLKEQVNAVTDLVGDVPVSEQISTAMSDLAPVRGIDYWTDSDIAEIKSYVDEAILGGAW